MRVKIKNLKMKIATFFIVTFAILFWTMPDAKATALSLLDSSVNDAEFRRRLSDMLDKSEHSIQAVREQIAESQSAPFLMDLYLQLAELLAQKSNTLYYIQMEKTGGDKNPGGFSIVVTTQKDSLAVYERVLREFPATAKKAQIHYRMALAYKSIDEKPEFMRLALAVVHDYPGTGEAIRCQLLLGQNALENHDYPNALKLFGQVADSTYVFERNLARYRMGLIGLATEKYQSALDRLEQVIVDPELKEQDNPYSVSLQSKSLKSDLKREALVDSVRAYTQLHGKGGEPVVYYSRIAPSEVYYQEVIEKLAVRYIYLKNFEPAVKLLRSLSERTSDPQRVVNIYREVLMMIPLSERAEIPVAEMRFVLDRYFRWSSAFELPAATRQDAFEFFEGQIRELATRNHSLGKEMTAGAVSKERAKVLTRARDYYQLYLAYFEGTEARPKMAANLADVYFLKSDWVLSGEYYLRAFDGEFGRPEAAQKTQLIENALLCLQKNSSDSFYETVRRRGLLIRALDTYIAASDARKSNASLAMLRAKTRYEQGVFPQSLEELFSVASRFPATLQAAQAGELILDYFNVRSDNEALSQWSGRLLGLHIADGAFRQKLLAIQARSTSLVLDERVRHAPGFDEFAQGQSYLKTALASTDSTLSHTALREALSKSREERDIETYLKTATVLGQRETDPEKKTDILETVAEQNTRMGRYYQALAVLKDVYSDSKVSHAKRISAYNHSLQTSVLMRDWPKVQELSGDGLWSEVAGGVRSQVKVAFNELLDSQLAISPDVARRLAFMDDSDEGWLALYKAQPRLPADVQAKLQQSLKHNCQRNER